MTGLPPSGTFYDYQIINNIGGIVKTGQTPYDVYGGMVVDLGIAVRKPGILDHEF
ncbi:MAG: hypothetical protein IPH84_16280 [Bacteroidales bacterium]|nr:hypothetical protein [Bacteroidales bacterium]